VSVIGDVVTEKDVIVIGVIDINVHFVGQCNKNITVILVSILF